MWLPLWTQAEPAKTKFRYLFNTHCLLRQIDCYFLESQNKHIFSSIERALNLMSPEIDKPISDDTDNPEIVERQQIISSGFDAMQSCWMGIQDQEEPHSR